MLTHVKTKLHNNITEQSSEGFRMIVTEQSSSPSTVNITTNEQESYENIANVPNDTFNNESQEKDENLVNILYYFLSL